MTEPQQRDTKWKAAFHARFSKVACRRHPAQNYSRFHSDPQLLTALRTSRMACPFCGEHCFCPVPDAESSVGTAVATLEPVNEVLDLSEQSFEASLNAPASSRNAPKREISSPRKVSFTAADISSPEVTDRNTKRVFRNVTASHVPQVSSRTSHEPANPNRITLKTVGALAKSAQPEVSTEEWRDTVSSCVAEHKAKRKKRTQEMSLDLFLTPPAETVPRLDAALLNTASSAQMDVDIQATVAEIIAYGEPMKAVERTEIDAVAKKTEGARNSTRTFVAETSILDLSSASMVKIAEAAPPDVPPDLPLVEGHRAEDVAALMEEIREANAREKTETGIALDDIRVIEKPSGVVNAETVLEEVSVAMQPTHPPDTYHRMGMSTPAAELETIDEIDIAEPVPARPENKVIEFPRYQQDEPVVDEAVAAAGVDEQLTLLEDELAEPVLTAPRILEATAPVTQPAPSPLETIRLDATEPDLSSAPDWVREYDEFSPANLDLPPQVAGFGQRLMACAVDALWVLAASALFAVIVSSITEFMPQGRIGLLAALSLPIFFWTAYQYLFLVFSGQTPGMQMAQLELCGFDGAYPSRRVRAQRSLAVLVSCVSVGLGFLWALIDEDRLGWHDRITKTYLRDC